MSNESVNDCNLIIDGIQYNITGGGYTILPTKIKAGTIINTWMRAWTGWALGGNHEWWYGRVWDDNYGGVMCQSDYRTSDGMNQNIDAFSVGSFTMPYHGFRGHFQFVNNDTDEVVARGASFEIQYDDGTTTQPPIIQPPSQCPAGYYFDPTVAECLQTEDYVPSTVKCPVFGSCPVSINGATCCNNDGYSYTCATQANGGYSWVAGASCGSSTIPGSGAAPVAKITATPSSGTSPLVVSFKESNTGSGITKGSIVFGDNSSDSLMGGFITHTYTKVGTYKVTYTVTNANGSNTATTTVTVSQGSIDNPSEKTCPACGTGYSCNKTTGVCVKNASTGTGTGTGAGAATPCVGLNRNGSLDPTCILETGNEMYLYGAIGLVLLLVLLKKK
jgi:hypothetical protein